jgi:hypothetical protein
LYRYTSAATTTCRERLGQSAAPPSPAVGLFIPEGCQNGYMNNTGCHQLVFLAIRHTRVVTPSVGHVDQHVF